MKTSYNEFTDVAIGKEQWERADTAKLVSGFETRDQTISQRDFAKMADVPRSTLRYWLARKNSIDAHPVLIEFFENPVGIAFLHRLVTAATYRLQKMELPAFTMLVIFWRNQACPLLWHHPIHLSAGCLNSWMTTSSSSEKSRIKDLVNKCR
ncbi:MAG: hypothetical protein J7K32_02330 [Deltaproteobacteria bacterium]|nr:hypothetical protein [Deltaproteobacteria bacterium]